MHQVKAPGFGKRREDLVQRRRKNKGLSDSCTKSKHPNLEKGVGTWCKGDGGTRGGADSCTKSKHPNLEKGVGTWCKGDGRTRV